MQLKVNKLLCFEFKQCHILIFIFGFVSEFCRNNLQTENVSGDLNIWLKEKWNPGEVKGLNLCNYIMALSVLGIYGSPHSTCAAM